MGETLRVLRSMAGLVGLCLLGNGAVAEGLTVTGPSATWPRWQARLDLSEAAGARLGAASLPGLSAPVRAALLGDYDLGSLGLSLPHVTGRFRATSGLVFGLGSTTAGGVMPWSDSGDRSASAPYLGVGYTGWLSKTGLTFSADLGLTADYPGGSWRFGRALFGNQGVDATLRELRVQPRLQLGVQYSY